MDEKKILDDAAIARRWFFEGTPEAIARRLDRITNKKRAGHLKSFKAGNKRLYRIEDVEEYESRAKHFAMSLSEWTACASVDVAERWVQAARLVDFQVT